MRLGCQGLTGRECGAEIRLSEGAAARETYTGGVSEAESETHRGNCDVGWVSQALNPPYELTLMATVVLSDYRTLTLLAGSFPKGGL